MDRMEEAISWPDVYIVAAKEIGEPPELPDGWTVAAVVGEEETADGIVALLALQWPTAHILYCGLHPVCGVRLLGTGWEKMPHMMMSEMLRSSLVKGPLRSTVLSAYFHVTTVPGGSYLPAFPTNDPGSPCTQEEFFREQRTNARTRIPEKRRARRACHGRSAES